MSHQPTRPVVPSLSDNRLLNVSQANQETKSNTKILLFKRVFSAIKTMYRDTSGLAMGTTTPFPGNLELIENYSLTRDDFVKHEIKIDGKGSKDGNSTIVVDGSFF